MKEIVSLYETPPTPPISLTALVKACEVINFLNIDNDIESNNNYDEENLIDK